MHVRFTLKHNSKMKDMLKIKRNISTAFLKLASHFLIF